MANKPIEDLTLTEQTTFRTEIGATDAANLTSGTLPDARFPATLPAASGVNLTALNATNLTSGTVATARLGTGTASSTTYLAGDGSWKAPASSAPAADSITTAMLQAGAVTTAKILDANVTLAKITGLGTAATAASTDFATSAQGTLATNAQPIMKGVVVTKANGTRTAYPPSADTDTARGLALEAAFAVAVAGDTIDLSPGDYLLTKEYGGATIGGLYAMFPLHSKMTVRLNGARLYRPALTTTAQNALVVGRWYIVTGNAGSTAQWTQAGAANNNGGTRFQATQTSVTGTGVCLQMPLAVFAQSYVSGAIPSIDWALLGPGIIEGDVATTAYTTGDPHGYKDQHGVTMVTNRRWRIDGISFLKHRGCGLYLNTPSWGNETTYINKASTGQISNCHFDLNNFGAAIEAQNEYHQFSNCTFSQNVVGVRINAGNIKFSNCDAVGNTVDAVYIEATGANPGHGCWTGGHLTHNLGRAIYNEALNTTGFQFVGVTIAGSSTTNTIESRGGGLNFVGCFIDCLFKAGAVPAGINTVQNCFFYQADVPLPATVVADMSTAERLRWKFKGNYGLGGPWGENEELVRVYADNAAALGTAIPITSIVSSVISSVMTATVTTTSPHGISVAASINILGATGTGVLPNGVQNATVTGASTLTFPLTTGSQTFGGTITATNLLMPGEQYRTSTGDTRIVY